MLSGLLQSSSGPEQLGVGTAEATSWQWRRRPGVLRHCYAATCATPCHRAPIYHAAMGAVCLGRRLRPRPSLALIAPVSPVPVATQPRATGTHEGTISDSDQLGRCHESQMMVGGAVGGHVERRSEVKERRSSSVRTILIRSVTN